MYFFVYGVCYTLFAPLLYMTVHYEDQNRVKQALEMEYQMTFDNLWSPYVVVAKLDDNPFALFVVTVILMLCAGAVTLVVVCSTVIYYTVKSKTGNLSIYTKKHHIVLLKSLLAMVRCKTRAKSIKNFPDSSYWVSSDYRHSNFSLYDNYAFSTSW